MPSLNGNFRKMLEIELLSREVRGKSNAALRKKGFVTCSITTFGRGTLPLKMDKATVNSVRKLNDVEIIKVKVDGREEYNCVVTEIIIDKLTNKVVNVSFVEITKKSHIKIRTPIKLVGVSPAVKNNLGVLVVNMPEVSLVCNIDNVQGRIECDISRLTDVGQRILVKDLQFPVGAKLASSKDREMAVVTVRPLQKIIAETSNIETEVATEEIATSTESEG